MQALIIIIVSTILMTFAAVAAPAPTVSNFSYNGSGCPDGSADGRLEANGNFGITFDKLEAYTRGDVAAASADCAFSVDIQPEAGWRMSIRRVLLDGIFEVSAHGRGKIATSYWMNWTGDGPHEGDWEPFRAQREFLPGFSGDFSIDDGLNAYPWSGCGERMQVLGDIEVNARRGSDPSEYTEVIVQNGVVRGQQKVQWHWVYERCDDRHDVPTFQGQWSSRYETEAGELVEARLGIDGERGTYDVGAAIGQLSGLRQVGDVVRGRWRLGQVNGWIEFHLNGDGTFTGTWGRGTASRVGGQWWGEVN